MPDLRRQLEHDKAMRDAARQLIQTDIAFLKNGSGEQPLKERVREQAGRAVDYGKDNKGLLGGGIALIVIALLGWLFRDRITRFVEQVLTDVAEGFAEGEPEQDD